MVSIGTGPGDPRAWVRAAYTLIEAVQNAAPGGKLPVQAQITAELAIYTNLKLRLPMWPNRPRS